MKTIPRILLALVCIIIALACTFGFLATFEPLPAFQQWSFRALYGTLGFVMLILTARLLAGLGGSTRR